MKKKQKKTKNITQNKHVQFNLFTQFILSSKHTKNKIKIC